jgi:death-on-curing protein
LGSEPVWLPAAALIDVNRRECLKAGHIVGVRDAGLLESACEKPKMLWYYEAEEDVLSLALALMFGVARNHPFLDGNKRTAFAGGDMFLQANGYEMPALLDSVALADMFVAVIAGETPQAAFLQHLQAYVEPL